MPKTTKLEILDEPKDNPSQPFVLNLHEISVAYFRLMGEKIPSTMSYNEAARIMMKNHSRQTVFNAVHRNIARVTMNKGTNNEWTTTYPVEWLTKNGTLRKQFSHNSKKGNK